MPPSVRSGCLRFSSRKTRRNRLGRAYYRSSTSLTRSSSRTTDPRTRRDSRIHLRGPCETDPDDPLRRGSVPQGPQLDVGPDTYSWILRFDFDFVARSSGSQSIANHVSLLRRLKPLRYYCIALSGVALDGDLHYQFPNRRDPREPPVFMYSPWLRCHIEGRWEALQVLWFYEKRVLPDAYYFYMRSVKSLQRMPQKLYWSHWYDARNRGSAVLLRDLESRQRRSGEWGGPEEP